MSPPPRVLVTRMGLLCACGMNVTELRQALANSQRSFRPLSLFAVPSQVADVPVGQLPLFSHEPGLARTHAMALAAAREAVGDGPAPDAIVLGTTTGGIGNTEEALLEGSQQPDRFGFHRFDSVASYVARELGVRGPVLTVSTACSSSAVAVAVARELIRTGTARRVLAGGADSLCRLTFHGFRQLQLLAAQGTRPLDKDRAGMTLGEGAGFLLLEADSTAPLAELAGCGLSCDGYHVTKPHPDGAGAARAMSEALSDAQQSPDTVDYVNLHGTGTTDNDATEIKALRSVFRDRMPLVSSTKGMMGHTLGAAGALEAAVSVLALRDGLVPANVGMREVDPELGVQPPCESMKRPLYSVMSNSFGFGGNNASLVLRTPGQEVVKGTSARPIGSLRVLGASCLTAAGDTEATWQAWLQGRSVAGLVPESAVAEPGAGRRLRKLSRVFLLLARRAHEASGQTSAPEVVSVGTAGGPLFETENFLRKLFQTKQLYSSPVDFAGSVHNAAAGQIAQMLQAHGPNLTFASGDRCFEHALLGASLYCRGEESALVAAAEAWNDALSPLLDPATANSGLASDGGAAFELAPDNDSAGVRVRFVAEEGGDDVELVDRLLLRSGGAEALGQRAGAILVGVPAREGPLARAQYARLQAAVGSHCPVIGYRDILGEHASVSAIATVIATRVLQTRLLAPWAGHLALLRPCVMMLSLGAWASSMEVTIQ